MHGQLVPESMRMRGLCVIVEISRLPYARGVQSPVQAAHGALVKAHGGIYVLAKSPEQAERLIREALRAG